MQVQGFKNIKKKINQIADQLEKSSKQKQQSYKKKYLSLTHQIQAIASVSDQCFNFILNKDTHAISKQSRDPQLLLNFYYQIINQILNHLKKHSLNKQYNFKQTETFSFQKKSSSAFMGGMTSSKMGSSAINLSNNSSPIVFQAMAKKNLQNFDLKKQVQQLNFKLSLTLKKLQISQQMTKKVQHQSTKVSQFYRLHLLQLLKLLKKAEFNEIELIQDKRYLTQQIQSIQFQFERYKKNFKQKPKMSEIEQKITRRLQVIYQNKLKQMSKKLQTENKLKINNLISNSNNSNGFRNTTNFRMSNVSKV